MQDLPRCKECTLPITWETLNLDNEGVCNICANWQVKKQKIDWAAREEAFIKIAEEAKARGGDYDCIVPYSGGKDSTYTLWALVKKYGLRPLVVSFDHGFYRPTMVENRTRTFRRLGVDVISFTPNWQIVRKMMLEALMRRGDFCWHCHTGVFAYPMRVAVNYKIPLVVWGEGSGEYEAYFKYDELEEMDEWKFNRRVILGIRAEDMAGFIGEDVKALSPFLYPDREELQAVGVKSIHLGNYVPWDVRKHVDVIQKELDWKLDTLESGIPNEPSYEKIECMLQGVRDYIKYLKRGFSRMTHLTTLDIRHGRMTREEGMRLIQELEGVRPASLKVFLEFVGITEAQFNEIVFQQLIPPAEAMDPTQLPQGAPMHDQDRWFRDPEDPADPNQSALFQKLQAEKTNQKSKVIQEIK